MVPCSFGWLRVRPFVWPSACLFVRVLACCSCVFAWLLVSVSVRSVVLFVCLIVLFICLSGRTRVRSFVCVCVRSLLLLVCLRDCVFAGLCVLLVVLCLFVHSLACLCGRPLSFVWLFVCVLVSVMLVVVVVCGGLFCPFGNSFAGLCVCLIVCWWWLFVRSFACVFVCLLGRLCVCLYALFGSCCW